MRLMKTNLNKDIMLRIGKRSFLYILAGYTIAFIPLNFVGAASSAYYLFISNNSLLSYLFPSFFSFLLVSGFPLVLFAGFVGYAYLKKTWLFRTNMEIQQESNSQIIINQFVLMESRLMVMQKLGIEPTADFMRRLEYWKVLYDKVEW